MSEAKSLSIKQAAVLLEVGDQAAREMIKARLIPGACCWGSEKHRTYYITDEQIKRFKKGEIGVENL